MAWAEHERRAVFDGAVPWATAPRAHLLALSGLRRLSDGCRWLDACAEFDRRKQLGLCFKCMTRDLQQVPFLDCPLHGARAVPTQPPAASVPRTRA
jgi:hypothetical protein